jgi:hypothetical protein
VKEHRLELRLEKPRGGDVPFRNSVVLQSSLSQAALARELILVCLKEHLKNSGDAIVYIRTGQWGQAAV